ncbi:hypothetical protein GCM10022205_23340 [Spinactinospora alkalitolerans]
MSRADTEYSAPPTKRDRSTLTHHRKPITGIHRPLHGHLGKNAWSEPENKNRNTRSNRTACPNPPAARPHPGPEPTTPERGPSPRFGTKALATACPSAIAADAGDAVSLQVGA